MSTRTLRDYFASLPNGSDATFVSPGLKKVGTDVFANRSEVDAAIEASDNAANLANTAIGLAGTAVQSIVAGSNITINNTDPQHPIISATGGGAVTSVALSAPTGFSVSGSPVTSSGTLALSYAAGYQGYTSAEAGKLAGITANADPTGATINAATAKTTPVNADTMPLIDSAASNALKKVTWANIKATLKSYFDTLYAAVVHTHTASQISDASANGRSLITAADYASMRTLLGLVIGTNVQAQNAKLNDIATATFATGDAPVWNGTNFVPQAAGGGSVIKSIQTGYVNNSSLTTGTGEDNKYVDVTVSAVTTAKVVVLPFQGGFGGTALAAAAKTLSSSVDTYIPTCRMTSTTNLRISTIGNPSFLVGRWVIVEYN